MGTAFAVLSLILQFMPGAGHQATATGVKETEAVNMLEKKFKANPQYTQKEVVELAISVLQVGCFCPS